MDTNDFNYGQTIFLVSFLAAELPSGLISKKVGPDRWIPFIIFAWSVISASQAGLSSKAGYYVCRCLIGLLMGGFIPDTVLYITYWYKSNELPIRLSWFWTVLSTCNILGSFLAAGILQMRGLRDMAGWRWLFLIEGTITACIGIVSWGLMPPSITQTSNWLRGMKGWFTEREEKILVNRLLRDSPDKGGMNNRQAVNLSRLWNAIKDFDLWPLYLVGLTNYIPPSPPSNYLSYILRQMGFSTLNANLLTIPSQFLFGVNVGISPKHILLQRQLTTHPAPHRLVGIREAGRKSFHLQHVQHLDFALARRVGRPRPLCERLGPLRPLDRLTLLPLLPCNPRGLEL